MKGLQPIWIGNALMAISWLLGLSYYHEARGVAWGLVMVLAVFCMSRLEPALPARGALAVCSALALPALWIAPWPFKAGPMLLFAGFALAALPLPAPWMRRLGAGLVGAGAAHLAQGLALLGYRAFTARHADLPESLVGLLAGLGNLAGGEFAADGSRLALYSMRELHSLAATWHLLLDPATACFAAGGLVLAALGPAGGNRSARRRLMVRILVTIGLWLPLRATLLLAIYAHRSLRTAYESDLALIDQFWNPWVHLVALAVPVALLWWRPGPRSSPVTEPIATEATPLPAIGSRPSGFAAAAAAAFLVTFTWHWEPIGPRAGGRVLVDDYHSLKPWPMKEYDTTRIDRRFDTSWWGRDSSYNHYSIYDYASRFYEVARQGEPLTEAALAKVDVLVLKVPSEAYSVAEQQAVRRFVARGGGLLLLGEHTSVFGSGVYLNEIASSYGFRFRYDCAFGIDSVFDQTYTPPLIPHPIVQFMRTMEFATSCTLEVRGAPGRPVMLCTGLKSLGADYHSSNFYPLPRDRPELRSGAFIQLWAARHGRGRIVAFTDSTIFSNFTVFEPGKSELMMGMLEWLNRGNPWLDWRWLTGLLGLGLLGRAARSISTGPGAWAVTLTAGLCGWALSVPTARLLNRTSMPYPPQLRPLVRLAIDQSVCKTRMPKNGFISGFVSTNLTPYATDFGQLERLSLRLGYFTKRTQRAEFPGSDLLILPFPNAERQDEVRNFEEEMAAYVRAGGKVLVLDAPENATSRANTLLARFGLSLKRQQPLARGTTAPREGWPAVPLASAFEIEGGTPFVWLAGRPVAAWTSYGQGSVCVLGFGSRFRDDQMGPSGDLEPQGELKAVFDFLFKLVPAVVTGTLPPPGPPAAPPPSTTPLQTLPTTPPASSTRAAVSTNVRPPPSQTGFMPLPTTTNLAAWQAWFSNHAPTHGWTNFWWTNETFLARWLADRAARLATNTAPLTRPPAQTNAPASP